MTKIIARIVCTALLLGAIPGLALAADKSDNSSQSSSSMTTSQHVGAAGQAADISGGDMIRGCSPSTTPCK